MLKTLVLLFLIGLVIFVPFFRFSFFNIPMYVWYAPRDLWDYIYYKRWRECPYYGSIKIYCATPIKRFGCGKTLTAAEVVTSIYRKYNGLEIYDKDMHAWIPQKITVISNIKLFGVPYIDFKSEQQFIDQEAAPGEVLIFLVDEIGTVWNNRDFKNFNPDVFQNIVQSRKRKMAIYGTLPVFAGTDVNIRRYTDRVYICQKTWRIIKHLCFIADDLENCSNVNMLQPVSLDYMFVTDRMYKQYDTVEMVSKLTQDMLDGKLLTYNELSDDTYKDIKFARLRKKFKKRQQ